jgi:uncharacterized SAM-binding protein YcdF (DUF218 family)
MEESMEILKRSIEIILSPLGIMTILTVLGIALGFIKTYSRAGRRFLICGGLLFLIFLFSPLSQYLIWNLERQFPPMIKPPESPKIDRIVVLAGYAEENLQLPITSNVTETTIGSMTEGLRLYRLLPGAKLVMSGGILRAGDRPVGALMADFIRQMGVPASDILVEGNSLNTYENLFEVRKLVQSKPFILVAAACDSRRAAAVAKKLRMNPFPAPSCIWTLRKGPGEGNTEEEFNDFFGSIRNPSFETLSRLQWACHEYLGYIWYCLLDRI